MLGNPMRRSLQGMVLVGAFVCAFAISSPAAAALPPTATLAYGVSSIARGGTTTLTITISNPNATPLTGIVVQDHLGAGTSSPGLSFVVALPSTNCSTVGVFSISGGGFTGNLGLAPNETCSISGFTINANGTGVQNNATDPLGSTQSGPGAPSNTAVLTVTGPTQPTAVIAFSGPSIVLGSSTSMSITISNPNPSSLTGVVLQDIIGAGTTSPGLSFGGSLPSSSCNGQGAMSINPTTFTSNLNLAAFETCTYTGFTVHGNAAGLQTNATQGLTSTQSGPGAPGPGATLNVIALPAPTATLSYAVSSIAKGGTTTLNYTLHNPNPATALTGVVFTDSVGAGTTSPGLSFVVALPSTNCSAAGVYSISPGTFNANLTLAPGETCSYTGLTVNGNGTGVQNNTAPAMSSTQSGLGVPSNTAVLTVTGPAQPIATITYGAPSVLLGGSTSMSITLNNPNAFPLTGVVMTDQIGAGTTSPGLNFVVSLPSSTCSSQGVMSITPTTFTSFLSLAAFETCSYHGFTVNGLILGPQSNPAQLTSTQAGPGAGSPALITVGNATAPVFQGAVARKVQGTGTFDLPIAP
jgi:uncharacterized repeat protein (TIGR01451 family)